GRRSGCRSRGWREVADGVPARLAARRGNRDLGPAMWRDAEPAGPAARAGRADPERPAGRPGAPRAGDPRPRVAEGRGRAPSARGTPPGSARARAGGGWMGGVGEMESELGAAPGCGFGACEGAAGATPSGRGGRSTTLDGHTLAGSARAPLGLSRDRARGRGDDALERLLLPVRDLRRGACPWRLARLQAAR